MIKKLGILAGLTSSLTLDKSLWAAESEPKFSRCAACVLEPLGTSKVHGLVSFNQDSVTLPVRIASSLRGLTPSSIYTLYIHRAG